MSDKDLQKYILDLIRIEQLFERGEDSDGDILGYYSEYTEMLNPEKIAGTPYTLKDTGAFYDSFLIYIYKNYYNKYGNLTTSIKEIRRPPFARNTAKNNVALLTIKEAVRCLFAR